MRVAIVGAGPVGSHFAKLMAQSGHEVILIEEHEEIGRPFQCTGILTKGILELVDIPEHIIFNRMKQVHVFSHDGTNFKAKNDDIIIDRPGFDAWLAKEAVKAGAQLYKSHRFLGFNEKQLHCKDLKNDRDKYFEADIVVGADGPISPVAKATGILGEREHYMGVQARVEGKFDPNKYDVYLDIPKFFGWVVPESETVARVGLAVLDQPRQHFDEMMSKLGYSNNCDYCNLDWQGGRIPIYDPNLEYHTKHNGMDVYLIGDAATHVKATTGGGIIQGMVAAQALCDALHGKGTYKSNLSKLRRELRLHLLVRDTLNKFNEKDYNKLIAMCGSDRIKHVLATESRDKPIRLMTKLFLAEPRLALYGRFLVK